MWIDASGDGAFKRLDIRVQSSSGGAAAAAGGGGNKKKGGGGGAVGTPVGNIGRAECELKSLARLTRGVKRRLASTRYKILH